MIVGVVVYLRRDPGAAIRTIEALRNTPEFEVGSPSDSRLPVVLEAPGEGGILALTRRLLAVPGVEHLDVVYVDLDSEPFTTPSEN